MKNVRDYEIKARAYLQYNTQYKYTVKNKKKIVCDELMTLFAWYKSTKQ